MKCNLFKIGVKTKCQHEQMIWNLADDPIHSGQTAEQYVDRSRELPNERVRSSMYETRMHTNGKRVLEVHF